MRWDIEQDEIVDNFAIFQTRRSTRVNPRTGSRFTFFLMRGLNWVNVIPITTKGEVVLVKQYRHGAEEITIEIPGGCVEKEEDHNPGISALRELEEETGYTTKEISPLGSIYANPAMQSMRVFTYLAKNCELSCSQSLDAGEEIEIFTKPLVDVYSMIRSGEIKHALVVAAFAHLLLKQT